MPRAEARLVAMDELDSRFRIGTWCDRCRGELSIVLGTDSTVSSEIAPGSWVLTVGEDSACESGLTFRISASLVWCCSSSRSMRRAFHSVIPSVMNIVQCLLTSGSPVLFAALANSPAARSCSSLAAIGFAFFVSENAFLA